MKTEQQTKIANAIARHLNSRFPDEGLRNARIAGNLAACIDDLHGRLNFTEADDMDLEDVIHTLERALVESGIPQCGPEFEPVESRKDDGNRVSEEVRGSLA